MSHLRSVLHKTNLRRHDIVVVTVRPVNPGASEFSLHGEQVFADYERELFSRVVTMAEKEGKTVDLLVVPGVNPYDALVQTAAKLKASRLVTGVSPHRIRMTGVEDRRAVGDAAGATASVLTGDAHAGPPEYLCKPGAAPAAIVAGGCRPAACPVAEAEREWRARDSPRDVVSLALERLEHDLDAVPDEIRERLRHD